MSILKVAKLGHPILRETAKPVRVKQIQTAEIQRLIQDMFDTMREYRGIGLAAPQVHIPFQIAVIEELEREQNKTTDAQVLINPAVEGISAEIQEDWEGCLSIPDLRGIVPRKRSIKVHALDARGKQLEFQVEGLHARVIQHECDHLAGRVFLDRMTSFQSLTYLQEFSRYWQKRGDTEGITDRLKGRGGQS